MFYVNRETELNAALLQKMINRFNIEVVPRLRKYKNYYDGIQKILNKTYTDKSKPCNKTVINYCKNISDSYCGYLATPSFISYSSQNDIENIMEVFPLSTSGKLPKSLSELSIAFLSNVFLTTAN